jgi:hypothetical protein
VADKATTAPNFSLLALVVRKDLLDIGEVKTLAFIPTASSTISSWTTLFNS